MEKKLQKNIFYILKFIDSARFVASSLSNLVNNFSEEIHRVTYKHDDKNMKLVELNTEIATVFLNILTL